MSVFIYFAIWVLIDLLVFKKVVDEGIENGLYSMKLSLRGEPLLHPNLSHMIRYAKEKGIADVCEGICERAKKQAETIHVKYKQHLISGLDFVKNLEGSSKIKGKNLFFSRRLPCKSSRKK